ncbi:MAG: hypothetical protein U9N61_09580 [Euryarchaeota archaeon]|nr:hypothetical protein [Euryarchaeota archaeon]
MTTLDGQQKYGIMNYRYAEQKFDGSWKYQASELVKHKDSRYHFHPVCEKEIEEPDITKASNFIDTRQKTPLLVVGRKSLWETGTMLPRVLGVGCEIDDQKGYVGRDG